MTKLFKDIKVGVTGSRYGPSIAQFVNYASLLAYLDSKSESIEVHHGGCIGVDEETHHTSIALGVPVIVHPPTDTKLTFVYEDCTTLEPKPYLDRNKDIVDSCDIILALPDKDETTTRSGTWQTIRYALSKNKEVIILHKAGDATNHNTVILLDYISNRKFYKPKLESI